MLNQVRVFLAEDEPFIALDLASTVKEFRGQVIGPAGSIGEALSLLGQTEPHVAVLDVNLSDGLITPIADILAGRAVPIMFYCGELPQHLRVRYPNARVCIKPMPPAKLLNTVAALVAR